MRRAALFAALLGAACGSGKAAQQPPARCAYEAGGAPSCCLQGRGCGAQLWCRSADCTCVDVTDPCSTTTFVASDAGTPDPGAVPAGNVGFDGGTADRLWFAFTGDTRPGTCDATDQYPREAVTRIAQSMKALKVQFALDLGDHMFVCNQSPAEARQQMGFYTQAIAQGPSTFWMTMGNHECQNQPCAVGTPDANFDAYLAALGRAAPWYSTDVQTSLGLARFVFIADDAWGPAQAAWLEGTLAAADAHARYTIVARHHPLAGGRTGPAEILAAIQRHKYSLVLTAHTHEYAHSSSTFGGRAVILGLGGAPASAAPGFGTILQQDDGALVFVRRDATGNPLGDTWSVTPQ